MSVPPFQSPPAAAEPRERRPFSLAAMVLSFASILMWPFFVVQILAIAAGIIGLRREPSGKGIAAGGIVVAGVMLITALALKVLFPYAEQVRFG